MLAQVTTLLRFVFSLQLVGLGQIAYGIWLVLHNVKVAGLLGGRVRLQHSLE